MATFVNSYPTLDVSYNLAKGDYSAGAPISMQVTLSRDADDEDEEDGDNEQTVIAPFFPKKKMSGWWLVVGDPASKQLHSIKRVTVNKRSLAVKLELTLPKGEHKLKLYVICDSYVGADHDIDMEPIEVAEGEESDSDEEMESDEAMEE